MYLKRHNSVMIVFASFTFITFLALVTLTFLFHAGSNCKFKHVIFQRINWTLIDSFFLAIIPYDSKTFLNEFKTDITPNYSIYYTILSIIFVWQFFWLVYVLLSLIRKTQDDCLIYKKHPFFDFPMLFWFFLANLLMIIGIFAAGNKFLNVNSIYYLLNENEIKRFFVLSGHLRWFLCQLWQWLLHLFHI